MLGFLFMMMGGVRASNVLISPEDDNYVGGEVLIEWNGTFGMGALAYSEHGCDGTAFNDGYIKELISSKGEYLWDTIDFLETNELEEGGYCIKIIWGENVYGNVSVTIDNTEPTANFTYDGVLIVGEEIEFDASDSEGEGSEIETYFWDFDDGTTDDESGNFVEHTYSEAGTYDVELTITDYAGNQDDFSLEIEVEPIEPEDTFYFEAGIREILDLDDSFDTGIEEVTCSEVGSNPGLTLDEDGSTCTFEWENISYEDRGVHELQVKATDGTTTKYFNVEVTVYTWMINLEEGWNLISIPMMPEDTNIDSVFANIYDSIVYEGTGTNTIFQYNGVEEEWNKARRYSDGSSYYEQFTGSLQIIPGYGYWIRMESEDTLKGIGSITPGINGQMLSVDVANGWNLIGHYGLKTLAYFDALTSLTLGESTDYYNSVVSDTGNMTTSQGYWMTAKFLPNGETQYTPAQDAINYILGI